MQKHSHAFLAISAALKKFERIAMDPMIVQGYLDDPLQALLSDSGLRIMQLISAMREAIVR